MLYLCECNNMIASMKKLEVCVESLESVKAARSGGAHRIELCAALSEGGVTPSHGMIEAARRLGPEKLHVLVRARGGNFVYSADEVDCMVSDIEMCRSLGVDGVVVGALTPQGDIDLDACRRMVDAASGMQVTFHRAFDCCNRPLEALEQIIALGCTRLLTSGQQDSAEQGIDLISKLVQQAGDRIIIMPGAGVNENNAAHILNATGAREIHGSIRTGNVTDPTKVKTLISHINEK